jgi:hypothetical protein
MRCDHDDLETLFLESTAPNFGRTWCAATSGLALSAKSSALEPTASPSQQLRRAHHLDQIDEPLQLHPNLLASVPLAALAATLPAILLQLWKRRSSIEGRILMFSGIDIS